MNELKSSYFIMKLNETNHNKQIKEEIKHIINQLDSLNCLILIKDINILNNRDISNLKSVIISIFKFKNERKKSLLSN